jgi:hypothetical protein
MVTVLAVAVATEAMVKMVPTMMVLVVVGATVAAAAAVAVVAGRGWVNSWVGLKCAQNHGMRKGCG